MADLLLLTQTVLEVLDLFAQHVVHLQLLLHHSLQLLHVGIHVEVHVAYALHFRYEFTLLREEFGVFLDGCHVRGEDFFLFFKDVGHFFLEGEVLFSDVVVLERGLHDVDILFDLLLVNFVHFRVHDFLDLFLDMVVLFVVVVLLELLLL
jgi:hypothetical protein